MKVVPVILSGGSGVRLWPLSREQYPKQYLNLFGEKTLLQETILRLKSLDYLDSPIVICNCDHRFIVAEQLNQIGIQNPKILLEPIGKNTAPAITAAAYTSNENDVLLILSADHLIQNINAFHRAIKIAFKYAAMDKLVTFGVVPHSAHTGYGYIEAQRTNDSFKGINIRRFKEKPPLNIAKKFIEENSKLNSQNLPRKWYWNSGIFMFRSKVFINELSMYSPETINIVKKSVDNATQDLDFIRLEKQSFELCPSGSVDYTLMEKSNNIVMVPLDCQWSDVGSWESLYDISYKDGKDNVIKGDVIANSTIGSYIYSSNRLVATIGINDLIIIDTPDALFVSAKDKAKKVKEIVNTLSIQKRKEGFCNRKEFRPWGWYDVLEYSSSFLVKKIYIKPKGILSLQKHFFRSEYWIILDGSAKVTLEEEVFILEKNDSIHIPLEAIHRLENYTEFPIKMIEVQSGPYLGEDDIERFEDVYGRL